MPALMSEEKTATNTSTTSRQRPGSACEECRRRKLRCDRQPQCGNCVEAGVVCTTTTVRPARGPKKGHLKALKGRIGKPSYLSCFDTMLTGICSNTWAMYYGTTRWYITATQRWVTVTRKHTAMQSRWRKYGQITWKTHIDRIYNIDNPSSICHSRACQSRFVCPQLHLICTNHTKIVVNQC